MTKIPFYLQSLFLFLFCFILLLLFVWMFVFPKCKLQLENHYGVLAVWNCVTMQISSCSTKIHVGKQCVLTGVSY